MRRILAGMAWVVVAWLLLASRAEASCSGSGLSWTCTAGSTAAQVNAAIASATSGATVTLEAGNYTWSEPVTVSGKALTIVGAGIGHTVVSVNAIKGLSLSVSATNFVTVSGITFYRGTNITGMVLISITGTVAEVGFRVHHCRFWDNEIGATSNRAIWPVDVYGLIDHNEFEIDNTTASEQMISASGDASTGGYQAWARPLTRGTANNVFIEDNTFDAGANQYESAIDGFSGLTVVVRYNTFTNTHAGFHGTDSGGYRSPVSIENYKNVFTQDSRSQTAAVQRGGTAVYFDNSWSGSKAWNGISLQYYRGDYYTVTSGTVAIENGSTTVTLTGGTFPAGLVGAQILVVGYGTPRVTANIDSTHLTVETPFTATASGLVWSYSWGGWGWCRGDDFDLGSSVLTNQGTRQTYTPIPGTTYRFPSAENADGLPLTTSGTRYFDGGTPATCGYPCRDQPGRGPGQVLAPVYAWNNTGSNTTVENRPPTANACGTSTTYMAPNRDYYNYVPSGFDGSEGVGRGTLAARPATCTTGVAYWVTDEGEWDSTHAGVDGQLYQCSATNTWTLYYTPYTYPHPLQGVTAPNAPTNVRIR